MRISPDAPLPSWSDFEFALECADRESRCYYDTETGEVHVTGPFEDDPGERERIDADPRRYREIGRLEAHEEHTWMSRFTETVTDPRLQGRLEGVLGGPKCFRRFKDALLDAPAERTRWFELRARLLHRWIEQWFETRDLAVGAPPSWWTTDHPAAPSAPTLQPSP